MVYDQHLMKTGCRAPYLKKNELHPKCSSNKTIKNGMYYKKVAERMEMPKACLRITKIRTECKIHENKYREYPMWYIRVLYPIEVKMISQSKEVDVHSLIGNIGGYIGLFLGNIQVYEYFDLEIIMPIIDI